MIEAAGFIAARPLRRTGFKSSPRTLGAEFVGRLPA
jgi:hypothetical protein